MSAPEVHTGDWVQVWGQVKDADVHPEDYLVEFFSHNEQFHAWVRRDRVIKSNWLPSFVETCRSLYDNYGSLLRCEGHDGHSDRHSHKAANKTWTDENAAGWFEAK